MRRRIFLLSIALSFRLLILLIGLIPIWDPHSTDASQYKPSAAEVAAAIEEQKQAAADLTRSPLAERKFQELSAKAQSSGTAPVIVQLRVAFSAYTYDATLESGVPELRLEYFEKTGGALVRLNWTQIPGP